jgi:hypothetical protein
MAKKAPTTAQRKRFEILAEMGCCICGQPSEIHHLTTGVGMGQKASHDDTIPLCPDHHRNGGWGVAIHAGKRTWEQTFGYETEWLERTNKLLLTLGY